MITVLLDSSNTNLSVGIARDNLLLDYVSYEAWQRQSEFMIVELNKLLEKHNIKKEEIKEVIVAKGPGSYTGVRIAITIAKTIAVALDAKLYAVSSLRVQKDGAFPSICVINARSNRSYVGVYQDQKILLDDCIMKNDEVLKYLQDHPNYVLCGEAKYLGQEGKQTNNLQEMLNLKDSLESINPLSLKPVYMKD
ncbi:MAG: tRNA (adenosine(37)-N6)-threonylcarbamoyltransferase complex dimerization subunit type 1 TsaB [Bacilli bacterium]|nr:tRNA (adenosine(37)-N6)-threonylcarbamoyltransferase complex dimerization subunit type 1 TsaB [Bacilli bacterium]